MHVCGGKKNQLTMVARNLIFAFPVLSVSLIVQNLDYLNNMLWTALVMSWSFSERPAGVSCHSSCDLSRHRKTRCANLLTLFGLRL